LGHLPWCHDKLHLLLPLHIQKQEPRSTCLLLLLLLLLLACRRFWQQLLGGLTLLDLAVLCFIAAMNASWMSGILLANMKKMAAKTAQRGLAAPTAVSSRSVP
jgi:hypothetical protein